MKSEHAFMIQHALQSAKWAFSTRRVRREDAEGVRSDVSAAVSGDLVLGRIVQVGAHPRLQLAEGRHSDLYEDDLVVVACGARYASDQFEGIAQLSNDGADLLAGGGCLGTVRERHARMKAPTRVQPLGLLCDATGSVLNLCNYAEPAPRYRGGMRVIGVVGASMNSGKTSAVSSLVHGLERAGYRTAAIKATGTGAFGDWWAYHDAGASFVTDFTDAGMVSTYRQPLARLREGLDRMLGRAEAAGCDVAVVELADGVLQEEARALLLDSFVRQHFGGFLFAAPDALAAVGGQASMAALGHPVLGLTGLLTASPLSAQEAGRATTLPVYSREALRDASTAASVLTQLPESVFHAHTASAPARQHEHA